MIFCVEICISVKKEEKVKVLNTTTKPMAKTISLAVEMFKTFLFSMLQKVEQSSSSGIYVD